MVSRYEKNLQIIEASKTKKQEKAKKKKKETSKKSKLAE
tara:strand:- start:411 stop:527 length:117 start_codon:yes stop_codon:yes gene_type:complete